jgi:hypothetical protein
MNFFSKKLNLKILLYVILNLFCILSLFSQNEKFNKSELSGEWENTLKFITFDFENQKIIHELKTFYGLWRDKPNSISFDELKVVPFVYESQLFMQYWILAENDSKLVNSKFKLFLPKSNICDISLDKSLIQTEIYAYLILDSLENVLKIRYWLCDLEIDNENLQNQKAMITENTVELNSNANFSKLSSLDDEYFRNIQKYIKIDDKLYTCAEGRGVKIRNVEKINLEREFSNYQIIEKDNTSYLVLDKPYLNFSKKIQD